jgi:DNA polymerase-1
VPTEHLLSEAVPYFQLGIYNARDTHWTWALCALHRDQLNGRHLDPDLPEDRTALRLGRFAKRIGVPMVRSITSMEQNGWLLDREWTLERLAEYDAEAAEAYQTLEAMAPGCPEDYDFEFSPPRSYQSGSNWFQWWSEVMIASGQLRVVETSAKTHAPSWTKAVLKRLAREGSDAAATLLAYRRADKRAQFLRSWLDAAQLTGRIHSTYSYYRVVTGRTSSSDPNMQQVTKDLRPAFLADPGEVLIESDLSQIELRVIAYIADCKPMIQAFNDGQDLHRLMAAKILNKRPEDVTDEDRQRAKAPNFGFAYMQQPMGFMNYALDVYEVEFTLEEATKAHRDYFDLWDGIEQWHAQVERTIERDGIIWSPLGRARRFPGIQDLDDYEFGSAVRQAVNAPVQSFASDLLQMSANKIRVEAPWIRLLGMVHDSVISTVPESRAEEAESIISRCMTSLDEDLLALGVRLPLPLKTETKISKRWGGELWKP